MPPHVNKLKHACRLCLMTTERHKRYELYVKSEVESEAPTDKDAGSAYQQNEFSNMILYEKVQFCCGIKLAPKSEFPSKICGKCFYMIHMWFNFRQMSCKSQIVLASQTSIKLEDDAISRNCTELQKMRNDLVNDKEIKEDEEVILPDAVKCSDNKVSYTIEKLEDGRLDTINSNKRLKLKSNDKEYAKGCDSKIDSEEESACGRVKENIFNKSQENEIYNSYEEEEDYLAEICIEEAILRSAHCGESHVNNNLNKNIVALEQENKQTPKDQIDGDSECDVAAQRKSQGEKLSEKSLSRIEENRDAIENNLCSEKEYNHNDADKISNQLGDCELESKSSNSHGKDSHNKAIESNIDYLLEESDLDDDKFRNATTEKQKHSRNKTRRKIPSNEKLQTVNNPIPSIGNASANDEAMKTKEPRKYMCSICGNIHTDYLLFRRHVRTHSKERPFKCEICAKGFRTPAFLKRHMVVHTHDKRFKCKYCGRHYTDASSRFRHEKTHLESPEFKCVICGKCFMYKTVLRRHVKLHSGEREYSCGVCNTSFALPHHLKNHIKSISHQEKQKSYEALGFKVVFETRESLDTQ